MSNCVYKSVDMMNTGDFVRKESCMKEYINSDNGKVSIDESVVAQVAGLTALDCFGIVGMWMFFTSLQSFFLRRR